MIPKSNAAVVLGAVLLALGIALGGCDTRPPCEVRCTNEVRCGFTPNEATCVSLCNSNFAMSSADCRLATDTYNRCWAAQNTCPASPTMAAPGCSAQFDQVSLMCTPRL